MFQLNWMEIAEKIDDLFLGDAEVCLNCVTKLIHININIIKLNIIFYYLKRLETIKFSSPVQLGTNGFGTLKSHSSHYCSKE